MIREREREINEGDQLVFCSLIIFLVSYNYIKKIKNKK